MEMRPIGTVHSPYTEVEDIPSCASERLEREAVVEVLPEYSGGLADVEGFSHLMLVAYLHRADTVKLTVVPPVDETRSRRGVFATRSPLRPNHIAVTIVELVAVDGTRLRVRGVDLLEGTPILDIKPFMPYDAREPVRMGWLEGGAISRDEPR
jgi:tRNA-Thr(GGU) m(6)t(6)A37 methyltransferase TsaA